MSLMRAHFSVLVCVLLAALAACGGGNSAAPTYAIGGTVSGITGSGLALKLNGDAALAFSSNGAFTFRGKLAGGSPYAVTAATQPTNPSQTCTVSNASGNIGNSDVLNVSVVCTTNTYAVGGTVTGISGSGLILQNNAGDDLSVTSNGGFSFSNHEMSGSSYSVTIKV